jgi:flagellar biosynthesis/type III secretory pathway M-ring protein FliF/YscJ
MTPSQRPNPARIEPSPGLDWDNSEALTRVIPQTGTPARVEPVVPMPAAKAPTSLVRVASYALLLMLVVGMLAKAVHRQRPSAAQKPFSRGGAGSPSALRSPPAASRPTIEARTVDAPSVKEAASAFARGDYREALAQYRALAQQEPERAAYRSLIRILERRLAPKAPPQ